MSLTRARRAPVARLLAFGCVLTLMVGGCSDEAAEPAPSSAPPSITAPATSGPTSVPTTAVPALADLTVTPGAVGPVRARMTRDEALATGLFDADVQVGGEECGRTEPLAWRSPLGSSLDVQTDDAGTIVSIGIRGTEPRTADGLGIGSTLAEVSKTYETAELTEAGYGQTGVFVSDGTAWLGLLFDADPQTIERSAEVTFMEVTSGTRPDLMRDGC